LAVVAITVTIALAARRYLRPSSVPWHTEIVGPLVESDQEYALVLRPFGRDGRIIVPKTFDFRGTTHVNRPIGFTYNTTLEQVVAEAVGSALNLETYSLIDQRVKFSPPGPTFMRATDDDWRLPMRRLIGRAHSIILVLPAHRDIGSSFEWEVQQIASCQMRSRVVMVLPPDDQGAEAHRRAVQHASLLVRTLDGLRDVGEATVMSGHEPSGSIPAGTLVVRVTEAGIRTWPSVGATSVGLIPKRAVASDATYRAALGAALQDIAREMSELGFRTRYVSV
jgi:hypothetical protein